MEEEKKRHFLNNELRKQRISMSQRRKHANLVQKRIDEDFNIQGIVDSQDIEELEKEYIRINNSIANQFLNICDKMVIRNLLKEKVQACQYLHDKTNNDNDINSHARRVIISPEQRDRIFNIEGDNEDEND